MLNPYIGTHKNKAYKISLQIMQKNLSSLESECESLRKENQKLKEQNRVLQDKNELTRENRKFTYGIELLRDQVERFEGCLLERIENENKDDKERICEHVDAIKGNLGMDMVWC